MKSRVRHQVSWLFVVALLVPQGASALVMTDNTLSISNIQISPTATIDPTFSSDFAGATAQNSLGEQAGPFDFSVPAQAKASVTWAEGQGNADAVNLTAHANSSVILPGFRNDANSSGLGELIFSFTVTGGSGPVAVTVSMQIDGSQNAFADIAGIVTRNEIVATLRLLVDPLADPGVDDPLLFYDNIISGGPDFTQASTVSTTLSKTVTLTYGTTYLVIVDADAESIAQNIPAPATFVLLLGGLGLMCGQRSITRRNGRIQ
jgi:hypothetical protein